MKRAVITAVGAVTPLGAGFSSSWAAMLKGQSGLGPPHPPQEQSRMYAAKWPCSGEVRELDEAALAERFGRKEQMRYDRFVLMALAAAEEAVQEAGLADTDMGAAAVVMGSSRGGISTLEASMQKRASAFLMSGTTISMAASRVAERFGTTGHIMGISNACASGANAIGEAMRLIRQGRAKVVIAGGSEAPLTPLCIRGYGASGALSKSGVMRPFDSRRDGFVLSEGAAVVVVEEYESALKRGARIYAEVAGYGNTSDAHHPTAPLSAGQARAIRAALEEAGAKAGDVGYISAHATATPKGDRAEAGAIMDIFTESGAHVSALKSMTGHMLAASGAFEAAVAARCLLEGVTPPTIESGQQEFRLNISPKPRQIKTSLATCNSFGFGGVNVVLALRSIK